MLHRSSSPVSSLQLVWLISRNPEDRIAVPPFKNNPPGGGPPFPTLSFLHTSLSGGKRKIRIKNKEKKTKDLEGGRGRLLATFRLSCRSLSLSLARSLHLASSCAPYVSAPPSSTPLPTPAQMGLWNRKQLEKSLAPRAPWR